MWKWGKIAYSERTKFITRGEIKSTSKLPTHLFPIFLQPPLPNLSFLSRRSMIPHLMQQYCHIQLLYMKVTQILQQAQNKLLNHAECLHTTQTSSSQKCMEEEVKYVLEKVVWNDIEGLADHLGKYADIAVVELCGELQRRRPREESKGEVVEQEGGNIKKEPNTKSERKSLLKGMLGFLNNNDNKAKPMILPANENKPVFDPKLGRWVFEDDDTEPQKPIPKPPSKSDIPKQSSKGSKKMSEMEKMMAPKGIKRKKHTQAQVNHQQSIFDFGSFVKKVIEEFANLKQELFQHCNEIQAMKESSMRNNQEQQFVNLRQISQKIVNIRGIKDRMLDELDIIENPMKQIEIQTITQMRLLLESQASIINTQNEKIKELKRQILQQKNLQAEQILNLSHLHLEKIEEKDKQIETLSNDNLKLKGQLESLNLDLQYLTNKYSSIQNQRRQQSNLLKIQIENLKSQMVKLQQQNKTQNQNYLNLCHQRQRKLSKRQEQHEKQLSTMTEIHHNQNAKVQQLEHKLDLVYDLNEAFTQQQSLYLQLKQKRLSLALDEQKHKIQPISENCEQNCVLKLSTISQSIVESYQIKVNQYRQESIDFQQKYQRTKRTLKKMQKDVMQENYSLQRSLNRLKFQYENQKLRTNQIQQEVNELRLSRSGLAHKILQIEKQKVEDIEQLLNVIKVSQEELKKVSFSFQQIKKQAQEEKNKGKYLQRNLLLKDLELEKTQTEILSLKNQIQVLRNQDEKLKEEIQSLKKMFLQESMKNQRNSQEIFTLVKLQENSDHEQKKMATENTQIQQTLNHVKNQLINLELKSKIDLQTQDEHIILLNNQKQSLQQQIHKITSDYRELQKEAETYKLILEQKMREIDCLSKSHDSLKDEFVLVEASFKQKMQQLLQKLRQGERKAETLLEIINQNSILIATAVKNSEDYKQIKQKQICTLTKQIILMKEQQQRIESFTFEMEKKIQEGLLCEQNNDDQNYSDDENTKQLFQVFDQSEKIQTRKSLLCQKFMKDEQSVDLSIIRLVKILENKYINLKDRFNKVQQQEKKLQVSTDSMKKQMHQLLEGVKSYLNEEQNPFKTLKNLQHTIIGQLKQNIFLLICQIDKKNQYSRKIQHLNQELRDNNQQIENDKFNLFVQNEFLKKGEQQNKKKLKKIQEKNESLKLINFKIEKQMQSMDIQLSKQKYILSEKYTYFSYLLEEVETGNLKIKCQEKERQQLETLIEISKKTFQQKEKQFQQEIHKLVEENKQFEKNLEVSKQNCDDLQKEINDLLEEKKLMLRVKDQFYEKASYWGKKQEVQTCIEKQSNKESMSEKGGVFSSFFSLFLTETQTKKIVNQEK